MAVGPGQKLESKLRIINDFPKKGIAFVDITTLLNDAEGLRDVIDLFYSEYKDKGITQVVGIESRGFTIAAVLAYKLGVGLSLIRKPGKLPFKTISESYDLEYGKNEIHIHTDTIKKGDKVLLMDDLLATGGTVGAAIKLVEKLGGEVAGVAFIIELDFLNGREKLDGKPIFTLIHRG